MTDKDEKKRAEFIRGVVADEDRFQVLHDIANSLTPIYKFLRLVDGYTPAVGKVYYKSSQIELKLDELAKKYPDDQWRADLHKFWVRDWGYMHVEMHSLGYCVDPGYHSCMDGMASEVWDRYGRSSSIVRLECSRLPRLSVGSPSIKSRPSTPLTKT